MAGWSEDKAATVKAAFYLFLDHCEVKSKEKGWIVLGQHLYGAQIRVIDAIFDGLGRDIHDFKVLKSRQLGVSTIIRALMAFWAGIFEITASLIFDTTQHLQEARQELVDMVERFPTSFDFPRIAQNNRYALRLANRSRINFASAGVKETKSSGTLGRGSAVSVSHRSELCSYGNVEGMEAYRASLARTNPDRLFVDESTARGFNLWYEIWEAARDDHHCICIFCGWWSHPDQIIERSDPDYQHYGEAPPTADERKKIEAVWKQYDHEITPEQLAWIRREMNPAITDEGDAEPDHSGDPLRIQEQPWTEEEAWQQTGSVFFDAEKLTAQTNSYSSNKYKTYSYSAGVEFTDFRVFPSPNARSIELKVWEPPVEESVYIIAADVAFGHNEHNDRSAIQVLRCYADGIDQVAEYAWPLINSRQFAWVIASLEGWYSGEKSEIYRIIEINGPGEATWRELQSLRHQLAHGYFGSQLAERGLENIQKNVRNYLYTRSDSMSPGHAYMWKTNTQLKVAIFERLRDFVSNGMLRIRSMATLEEMRTITREGDSIEAGGTAKDDRVFAMALAVRNWDERVRRQLITLKRTRDNEAARRRLNIRDQANMFNQSQFDSYMAGKGVVRRNALRAMRRQGWRG